MDGELKYNSAIGRYNAEGYEKKTRYRFWMVFVEGKNMPTVRHPSEGSAQREAERLAREFPDYDVFVLFAGSFVRQAAPEPPVKWQNTTGESGGRPMDTCDFLTGKVK